jgi:myosin heavy subunit
MMHPPRVLRTSIRARTRALGACNQALSISNLLYLVVMIALTGLFFALQCTSASGICSGFLHLHAYKSLASTQKVVEAKELGPKQRAQKSAMLLDARNKLAAKLKVREQQLKEQAEAAAHQQEELSSLEKKAAEQEQSLSGAKDRHNRLLGQMKQWVQQLRGQAEAAAHQQEELSSLEKKLAEQEQSLSGAKDRHNRLLEQMKQRVAEEVENRLKEVAEVENKLKEQSERRFKEQNKYKRRYTRQARLPYKKGHIYNNMELRRTAKTKLDCIKRLSNSFCEGECDTANAASACQVFPDWALKAGAAAAGTAPGTPAAGATAEPLQLLKVRPHTYPHFH